MRVWFALAALEVLAAIGLAACSADTPSGEPRGFVRGMADASTTADASNDADASNEVSNTGNGAVPEGGQGPESGPPAPTPVCGTPLLDGPTSAPDGAVTVMPGASTIQTALAQNLGGGTTYYLTAGTYAISSSIDPHDNDTFIGAPGAIIDGSNTQQVAFGLNDPATGVTIKYLTIQHFVGPQNNGIVNQGQGAGWTIQYNTIQNNPFTIGGANAIEVGDEDVISYNCLTGNGQTGLSAVGNKGFVIDHNEVSFNAAGYEPLFNCGCSGGMKFFTSTSGTITNNWIHDNGNVGLWVDTNNSFFLIRDNVIENNVAEGLMYEISYNAVIDHNLFRYNGIAANPQSAAFPEPSVYISESGGFDAGPAVMLSGVDVNGVLQITNNTFYDDADGVVLYQNGTRCCGAMDGCNSNCGTLPMYPELDSDGNQRWNTQNVTVSNDLFTHDADAGCTVDPAQHNYCAVAAMFSTVTGIDQALAFHQGNVFRNNVYAGPWQFLAPDQNSTLMSPSAWQAAPFNQDQGSEFR